MSFGPGGGLGSEMAPSLSLPFRYFVASLVFLAFFAVLMPFYGGVLLGGFFQPQLLALVHVVTLGWITTTIIGATFQLVPVALQVPLASERLGRWLFPLWLIGVSALTTGFWLFDTRALILAGLFILVSGLLYLTLMFRTLALVKQWDVIAWHMAVSFGHLALIGLLAGLLILHNRFGILGRVFMPLLQTHALLAVVGFASVLIMGVAYKLIPMFTLTEDLWSPRRSWIELGLLHLGLAGIIGGWLVGWLVILPGMVALVVGGGLFVGQVFTLYRRRRRRVFDISTPFILAATSFFALLLAVSGLAVAGLIPTPPRLWMTLGYVALLGWIGQIVMGMMYKITTFLTWLNRYAARIGHEPVPRLDDLYSRDLALVSWGLWNAGVVIGAAVIATGWAPLLLAGSLNLALGAGLFLVNMGLIATR